MLPLITVLYLVTTVTMEAVLIVLVPTPVSVIQVLLETSVTLTLMNA